MARRSEARRDEMRAHILDLARAMIEEEGAGAISARTLARRAGIVPGSLYNLFSSIEDIRLAALGDALRLLGDALAAVPRTLEPAARLHAYARAYIAYIEKNANAWNALFEYRRNASQPAPDWYQAYIARLTEMIGACFAELCPERPVEDAQTQGHLLWAGIYGLTALASEGRLDMIAGKRFEDLVSGLVATHVAGFRGLS